MIAVIMDKLSKIQREKIEAAYRLLTEETTTFGKFEKIRTLAKGFNPKIDQALAECSRVVSKLKKIQRGEVIELAAERLGEDTPQKKKRKKMLLLFLGRWKTLKAEVKRVREIYQSHKESQDSGVKKNLETAAHVAHGAKGPWGLITGLAVGAVAVGGILAYLNSAAVSVIIKNNGCAPITPVVNAPVSIPGISLPSSTIGDGEAAEAKLPPLTVAVDGSRRDLITISTLGLTMNYELGGEGINLIFNGESLVGRQTTVNLGESKTHELIIRCS